MTGAGGAPAPWRLRRATRETHDTVTLEIEPVGRDGGMAWLPGQFNMLYLFGVGEVPISISGDPAEPRVLVHTVRAVGAVTRGLCRLKRGQVLGVRGPFGSGWPLGPAIGSDVVVVAGGIGLAALRAALYHLLGHRGQYGRIAVLYGARTPDDLLYARGLAQWRGRFDLQIEATVDAAGTGAWAGHVGVVTTLIPRAEFEAAEAIAFVCGPEVMMRFTIADLRHRGLTADRIYLSMERNMECAIGLCGHCQFGPTFICKDGPVFRYDRVEPLLKIREV
ncbi:MAG TPA: FAD/NAD(P)-binding protein [bacterium]|nr:FAD/NAD(P)-binding protein [bacterium]